MDVNDFFLTDFSEELFLNAFKKMLLEEYGIISVDNYELMQKKLESDGDSFAYVKQSDDNEIEGLIIAKVIKLSKGNYEAVFGYISTLWISKDCLKQDCGVQLLELCEEQFEKRQITQFIADADAPNVDLFLNNHYTKNKSFLHNGKPVLCKK